MRDMPIGLRPAALEPALFRDVRIAIAFWGCPSSQVNQGDATGTYGGSRFVVWLCRPELHLAPTGKLETPHVVLSCQHGSPRR